MILASYYSELSTTNLILLPVTWILNSDVLEISIPDRGALLLRDITETFYLTGNSDFPCLLCPPDALKPTG